ncbi:MAG: hypothetical protein ACI8X3_001830 [Saprospiraceae bacterium]|jgi:hypothetical protein
MRIILTCLIFFLLLSGTIGQINGKITNKDGAALSFASVYVQGTSRGTTTNFEGDYFLELTPGSYKIVFQYVGYKQLVKEIEIGKNPIRVDVALEEEALILQEVVVKANAEDPAYAIIRKAIEKRKYYRDRVDEYACDVYIKGVNKLLDAPEKIFGQDLGNMGGMLDTNRQGIVYLSESEAKLFFQKPDQKKEQMISSKISGNDNGFSFNQASSMDFSFYENFIEIERKLISPIADNALAYYRYKLLGTLFDEGGRLINKIEVLPKREQDPVFRGLIYIVEDLWNIQSTELIITGASIQQSILDTLIITQLHVPVKAPDTWMLLSQSLDFKFGLLGFKVEGNFTGVFSNYDLDPQFEKGFFTNEIFKVEEGANEKTLTYWDSIRPIPLTIEESDDYVKKDSLQEIWESKEYRDSMDRKNNKFNVMNLFFGYQYNKSFKKAYFSIGSPLSTIQFNPIQGWYGNVDILFRKVYDEHNTKWLRVNPQIQYGLSDKKWRAGVQVEYNFSSETFSRLSFSGGIDMVTQFNDNEPISPFLNTYYSLLGKKNYMRVYEKDYFNLRYRRELTNGLFFTGKVEYAERSNLENTTNKSWRKKDAIYFSNVPEHPIALSEEAIKDEAILVEMNFRIRFDQKYITYPNQKFIMGSKYPDFWIRYKKGLMDVDFDQLSLEVSDNISTGLVGESEFKIETGWFLNNNKMRFIDFQHFNGNQTFIFNPDKFLSSFLLMPYYERSTNDYYVQGHYQHHFNGFLFDKVPLLRKAGFKTVFGAAYLYTPENKNYLELSYGIENLGFGILKILRVDAVASFDEWKYRKFGVRLGITI